MLRAGICLASCKAKVAKARRVVVIPNLQLRLRKLAATFVKLALQLNRRLGASCSIARRSCMDSGWSCRRNHVCFWILLFRTRHLEQELAH